MIGGTSILKGLMPMIQVTVVRNYTPRRAIMYVPGDDLKKISKAFTLNVDCLALDCEDGVAVNRKDEARNNIKQVLTNYKSNNSPKKVDLGVRVNSVDSGLCQDDLKSILSGSTIPDTILLPKVECCEHLNWFADLIENLMMSTQKINLIMYIESAVAFVNLADICKCAVEVSKRHTKFTPTSLIFGSDDFCASIGALRTDDCAELIYARQKLVLTAKAFDLQAIDMVYIKYKDLEGLREQSRQGMMMGFTGKQVIHPAQVPVVQQAFLPIPKQVEWARELLQKFDEHQKSGKGVFTYKGSMIDMPTMKQAKNIVELSKLA